MYFLPKVDGINQKLSASVENGIHSIGVSRVPTMCLCTGGAGQPCDAFKELEV